MEPTKDQGVVAVASEAAQAVVAQAAVPAEETPRARIIDPRPVELCRSKVPELPCRVTKWVLNCSRPGSLSPPNVEDVVLLDGAVASAQGNDRPYTVRRVVLSFAVVIAC